MKSATPKQSPKKERVAEVTERPISPDMTYLPAELVDHFEAQGFKVTMASRLPDEVAKLAGYARHPIAISDLPEELQERNGLALRKYGIWTDPAGLLYKGDCYLYQQSYEAHDAQMAEGRDMWLQQDRGEVDHERAEELTDKIFGETRDRNIARVQVHSTSRLSEFIGRA